MKKKLLMSVGTLLLACSLPLSGLAASNQQFKDVPSTKHFAEAVNDLVERNIIGGYPDGTFKPRNSITRGQAASIIAKITKLDITNVKDPGFVDVSTANGYYKAIAALAENNIISGYGDGNYGPNNPINRGQMASILVKAFDLPRYTNVDNPFIDVDASGGYGSSSHAANILILYKLGITTGTSPDRFSASKAITRGQAAKLIKAAEDTKPTITVLKPEDFGWKTFTSAVADPLKTDVLDAVVVKGKAGYSEDTVQLVLGKEGTSTLTLNDTKKFIVTVKSVNGVLQATLEEASGFLSQAADLGTYMTKEDKQNLESITLSTMEGKKLPNAAFSLSEVKVSIDEPGQYIAVARIVRGKEVKEVRYGIESKFNEQTKKESITVLKEFPVAEYKHRTNFNIGKHTIVTENHQQIADVTRDPGTNTFHVTGKNTGTVQIDYENPIDNEGYCYDYTCIDNIKTGLTVEVEKIGSIVNVTIKQTEEY